MQKLKINFKKQEGMTIILSLMGVLILSITAAVLLTVQNTATQAFNQIIDVEVAKDATDFCIAEALDTLGKFSANQTLTSTNLYYDLKPNLNYISTNDCSRATSGADAFRPIGATSKIMCAFIDSTGADTGVAITNKRISNQNKMYFSTTDVCKYDYMTGYDGVTSSSNGEIVSSRAYGTSSTTAMKYFKITAIKEINDTRIEYQVFAGI